MPVHKVDEEGSPRMLVPDPTAERFRHRKKVVETDATRRRDGRHCPVCVVRLRKTAAGSRRRRSCVVCGASRQAEKLCRKCPPLASAIWQGKRGTACGTCGRHGAKDEVLRPGIKPSEKSRPSE